MNKLSSIIIEDESLAAELLSKYLINHEKITVEGIFSDGYSGLKAIQELKPDLVFLDIELPKITGLEILELLDTPPMIVFTTAYNQYAIEAFEKNAVDYLLKPFSKTRLMNAIDKALSRKETLANNNIESMISSINEKDDTTLDRIAVKNKNEIHLIDVNDILYLEAQDDYVNIRTQKEQFLKNATLKFYEQNLDKNIFIRVHRSYIVNAKFIKKLENYSKDSFLLILDNEEKINVSRSGLQLLRKILYL
jgi:two-component system LytT family response regulator